MYTLSKVQYTQDSQKIENLNYESLCVYNGNKLFATLIVVGKNDESNTQGRLIEIHIIDSKCSIDNVVEAVKKEGINVDSFFVIKMPCRA